MNQQHSAAWEVPNEFEDQIMTVTSHDGGVHWSNPVHVADMEDVLAALKRILGLGLNSLEIHLRVGVVVINRYAPVDV